MAESKGLDSGLLREKEQSKRSQGHLPGEIED